jgi:hypothetical protein
MCEHPVQFRRAAQKQHVADIGFTRGGIHGGLAELEEIQE